MTYHVCVGQRVICRSQVQGSTRVISFGEKHIYIKLSGNGKIVCKVSSYIFPCFFFFESLPFFFEWAFQFRAISTQ